MLKNEKMNVKKTAGCVLGLAGVVVVNLSSGTWGSGFTMKGEGMVLICTIVYAISMVLLKLISNEESPMTITAYQTLIGGALLIVSGLFMDGHVAGFTGKSVVLLVYMALLSTVAFSVWTILMKYNPVGKVAMYTFTIPIFGTALSGLILGENVLEWKNLAALVLVSSGIIIVNRPQRHA